MVVAVLLIILGFVLLIKGADFLVEGSSILAKRFHIPEIIIGLTIVSIGTSMPELFVSVMSATEGASDLSLGNVIGSNICNLMLILGMSAVIRPMNFQKQTRSIDIPISLVATILFMFLCNTSRLITRFEAGILLVCFVGFIAYTIVMGIKGAKEADDSEENGNEKLDKKFSSMLKDFAWIVVGIVALKFGGDLTVDNARVIAEMIGVSEKVIGLTIVAVGTSLPELVTSVIAARRGNSDIAIGNVVGSNIFNILFIIGTAAMIQPIRYNVTYNIQFAILLVATITLLVFPMIKPKDKMSRANGFVYLAMYLGYLALTFFI